MIPSRHGTTIAFKKGGSSMNKMKKICSLLLFVVLLLSVLAQPVLAEKPGDECVIVVPFKAPEGIKHLYIVGVNYSLSSGLTFVSASSDGSLIIIPEMSEPGFFMGIAPNQGETAYQTGLTQGELKIRVKINDNAANRETVNVTNIEGASFEDDLWQGSAGTPKEHVISVDASMRGVSGEQGVAEDTAATETEPKQSFPKTGESSGYYPWLSLLLISAGGLFLLARRRKISQQRD